MDMCPGVLRSESHRLGTPVLGSYAGSQAPLSDWKTTGINICLWEAWVPLMCHHKHSLAPEAGWTEVCPTDSQDFTTNSAQPSLMQLKTPVSLMNIGAAQDLGAMTMKEIPLGDADGTSSQGRV